MKIYCLATVTDELQRQNLFQCIEILGGKPFSISEEVTLDFEGSPLQCDKFIELFSQYPYHAIYTQQ